MEPTITTDATETEITVTLRIPRTMFVAAGLSPATVTQHTAEAHFGIPPRAFRELARAGKFPVKRIGKMLFAAYADVHRAVTEGAEFRRREDAAARPRPKPPTDEELHQACVEAAHYIAKAATRREHRARQGEVAGRGWELQKRHPERLEDGTPNPAFDKRMHEHGTELVLIATIQRFGQPAQWFNRKPPEGK